MPALSCSAMTCVYNQNELCSKGDIRVGGSGAKSSMETCCESFKERGEGTMSNSTGCGCTKIGVEMRSRRYPYRRRQRMQLPGNRVQLLPLWLREINTKKYENQY